MKNRDEGPDSGPIMSILLIAIVLVIVAVT